MWNGTEKVYFIGICGISLSALAKILKIQGHEVAGSDASVSEIASDLRSCGINVINGHNTNEIDKYDVVVYSAAISQDNYELLRAKKLHKKIITRAKLLGELSKHYKSTIAICGCHGKTTTTGMISSIFINANLDPTIHIGGSYDKIGGNVRVGKSDIFITEACEYKDSFLSLKPKVSVVLGVQADHLDYFKTISNIQSSFNKFASNTKKNGLLVFDCDNNRSKETASFSKSRVIGISKKI